MTGTVAMNAYRVKPLSFPWPPLFYGAAIFAAWMFHQFAGLPALLPNEKLRWITGATMISMAIGLDLWATKTLLESCTTILPHRASRHLVTHGPYRYTRNPIYLGYTLITMGIGLFTGNAWFFIMATLAAVFTTMLAIRREEMHLHARFGIEYERYCRKTRRWI